MPVEDALCILALRSAERWGGGGGGGSQGNCPGAQAITIRSESYRKLAFNRRLTHSSKLVAYKNRF